LAQGQSETTSKLPVLKGTYLGQKPQGNISEIFAPHIISHRFHEPGISFSPDGKEIFYVTSDKSYSHYFQIHLERKDDGWSAPEVSPFMGNYSIGFQCFSPDGKYLFFSSYRTFNPEDFKGKSYTELMKLYRSPKNGYATLYWVNAKIIEELRPKELK
jgi:hypothetical protein